MRKRNSKLIFGMTVCFDFFYDLAYIKLIHGGWSNFIRNLWRSRQSEDAPSKFHPKFTPHRVTTDSHTPTRVKLQIRICYFTIQTFIHTDVYFLPQVVGDCRGTSASIHPFSRWTESTTKKNPTKIFRVREVYSGGKQTLAVGWKLRRRLDEVTEATDGR